VFREFSIPAKCVRPRAAESEARRWFHPLEVHGRRILRRFVHPCVSAFSAFACVTALLLLMYPPLLKAQGDVAEYRTKAKFLTTFPSFIDWPEAAFSSVHAPLTVCVRGDFSFGTSLAELARAEAPHGRHIEVRWVHRDQDLRNCHIVFISRSESRRYAEILQTLGGAHVLTVGETADFLDAGGAITFTFQGAVLHFEVNLAAATSARLRISSRLLAIALRVVNQTEAAKS